jgi:uncharacterized protein YbaR (Trm112 family)
MAGKTFKRQGLSRAFVPLRRVDFEYNALVMIAKDLLEILVCPACKQALEYRENPESLKCGQCHRVYAVKDDIPIMLVDEATIES